MSIWLFGFQSALIGATTWAIAPRHFLLRTQIIIWSIGVVVIAAIYGVEEQVVFYSNDQIHYSWVVRIIRNWDWMSQTSVDGAKLPFTLAALPFALIGVNETLALKTVSLVCILVLTRLLLNRFPHYSLKSQVKVLYFTGCGLIGTFFSLLALRETMMMLFTYLYVTSRSTATRVTSAIILYLLRPHLAGALILAEIILAVWKWIGLNRRHGYLEVPPLVLMGIVFGNVIFTWQLRTATLTDIPLFYNWGTAEVTRIASNFAGLQFLTADRVNFSIESLLLLRIVLSETLIIPTLFAIFVFFLNRHNSHRNRLVLLTFAIYVGIATNTDFNSFRQNIPLMPLMGLAILEFLEERRIRTSTPLLDTSRRLTKGNATKVPTTAQLGT